GRRDRRPSGRDLPRPGKARAGSVRLVGAGPGAAAATAPSQRLGRLAERRGGGGPSRVLVAPEGNAPSPDVSTGGPRGGGRPSQPRRRKYSSTDPTSTAMIASTPGYPQRSRNSGLCSKFMP